VSVDPETGKVAGVTYGRDEANRYSTWSGTFLMTWTFALQHIGVGPGTPQAGAPFSVHAPTGVVAPHTVSGKVLLTVDRDAGGLPLRYRPGADLLMRCSLAQFDPVKTVTAIDCPTVTQESGQFVVSTLEPLVPGFALDVQLPRRGRQPHLGHHAMTAMWATTDVGPTLDTILATVPVTVAPAPAPPVSRQPAPAPVQPAPTARDEDTA
jgi:hypothetical protein